MTGRLGRLTTVTAVVASSVLALGGVVHADPLTDPLYYFTGAVTDPIGRPVAAATVSDTMKSATTDTAGAYRLGERDVNKTYRLTASKAGMDAASKDVTVLAPIDTVASFTLQYRTTAALRDTSLTGVSAGSTILDVTTYAPNPGLPGSTGGTSCVTVADSGAGTTTDASFVGYAADGAAKWEWTLNVDTGTPERTGVLTVKVATCDTATTLTRTATATYVIDDTPVTISDLQPKDGSTTAHALSQVVSATVRDSGGAGVDPSSIALSVVDTTTGVTRQLSGLSYNASTGRVTAAPVALTVGHRHRVEVSAADRAGNSLSFGQRTEADGGAYATTVDLPGLNVAIPPVTCTLGATNLQTQKKDVTCDNVLLDVAPTGSVTLHGSGRAGTGFVESTAPIQNGRVSYYVADSKLGEAVGTYDPGVSGYTALRYDVAAASDSDITASVSGRTVALGRVTAQVSAVATSATFAMGTQLIAATASTCSNPSTISGPVRCVSDPLETAMVVQAKAGVDATALSQQHAAKYGIQIDKVAAGMYLAKVPNGVVAKLRADANVQAVARDLEYDYKVSYAEMVKHDVTSTAFGQSALVGTENITGDDLRVYDLSAAAGLINDGLRPDTTVQQNAATTQSGSSTDTIVNNATLYSIETSVGTASHTSQGSEPGSGSGSFQQGFRWVQRYQNCWNRFEDSHAWVDKCARIYWASGDGEAGSTDVWAFEGYGSAASKAPWNLREAYIASSARSSGQSWYDWSPRSSINAGNCNPLNVGVGYTNPQTGIGITLSTTRNFCEWLQPSKGGSAADFSLTWSGDVEAQMRDIDYWFIVKAPSSGVSFWVRSGYSWSFF